MNYETLIHIYRKLPQKHKENYDHRFNSYNTLHFNFNIKQYHRKNGFPAFICFNKEIYKLIEDIFLENAKLVSLLTKIPPVVLSQFYMLCVVDEVRASNEIEGIHSTRRELQNIIENMDSNSRFASILNKYDLILQSKHIDFLTCQDIRTFYDGFAHEEVVKNNISNKLDGKIFRNSSVDIQSPTGKIIHQGVFPEEKIILYMNEALKILHDSSLPVLLRASIFHYLFAYIHPFYDGNGRTARFISSNTISKVLHKSVALRLSGIIKRRKKTYYKMFEDTDSELNCGELTAFVLTFLEFIYQTIIDTHNLLQRKLKQFEKNIQVLRNLTNDETTFQIYAILLQSSFLYGKGITPEEIARNIKKSKNTVLERLRKMPKSHLLVNKFQRKNFYKLNILSLLKPTK